MKTMIHSLLDSPTVYALVQSLFAPGAEKSIVENLTDLAGRLPKPGRLLDLGCGPSSWLWKIDWQPLGLDLSYSYARAFSNLNKDRSAVTGSCCSLPFADRCFDGVWTIGVLHHLDDADVRKTLDEMLRVCRPSGYVVVMDAVLPRSVTQKPIAYLIRKMDRGVHMRTQAELEALLPISSNREIKRYTYSHTGLEMLECVCRPVRQES